jgi:O-antigen/teichoic acid export membrane protein
MTGSSSTAEGKRLAEKDLTLLARGGGVMVGGGFAEFVFRLGIALVLARALGADGYGVYALVVGVSALTVAVGGFGLDDAMVRYLAIQTNRGDRAAIRGTIQVGVIGALAVGAVAGTGLFFLAPWIAIDLFGEPEMVSLLRIVSAVVPFLLVSNVLLGVTRGFNRMDYATFAENIVQSGVRLALLLILWLIDLNVLTAVLAFGLADISATLVFIHFTRKLTRHPGPPVPARREYRQILGFALPLWISGLLNRFRGRIETFVLGALAIAADVGVFAVAARVNLVSHTLYRSVIVSVKPVLAQAFADEDRERLARTYSATTRWTFTMAIPFFLASVLYPEEILSVFGADFVAGTQALMIMAAGELVVAATGTCGSMIDMAGHTRVKVFNSVLWIGTALALNLLLIPRFGVVGAALGSMGSLALINLVRVLEVWMLDRLQPYRADFWKPIVAGSAAAGWALGLKAVAGDLSFLMAAAHGITVVGVYVALLVAFGVHDEDRVILSRVRGKMSRRLRPRAR